MFDYVKLKQCSKLISSSCLMSISPCSWPPGRKRPYLLDFWTYFEGFTKGDNENDKCFMSSSWFVDPKHICFTSVCIKLKERKMEKWQFK